MSAFSKVRTTALGRALGGPGGVAVDGGRAGGRVRRLRHDRGGEHCHRRWDTAYDEREDDYDREQSGHPTAALYPCTIPSHAPDLPGRTRGDRGQDDGRATNVQGLDPAERA